MSSHQTSMTSWIFLSYDNILVAHVIFVFHYFYSLSSSLILLVLFGVGVWKNHVVQHCPPVKTLSIYLSFHSRLSFTILLFFKSYLIHRFFFFLNANNIPFFSSVHLNISSSHSLLPTLSFISTFLGSIYFNLSKLKLNSLSLHCTVLRNFFSLSSYISVLFV